MPVQSSAFNTLISPVQYLTEFQRRIPLIGMIGFFEKRFYLSGELLQTIMIA